MYKYYSFLVFISFSFISMNAQFSDDMESYTVGQPIDVAHWTNWACGGGPGCALMASSAQAHEGNKSGLIPGDSSTDVVLDLGNKIFGEWGLSFWMYVPSGNSAYFNLQGTVPIGDGDWLVGNIFFNEDNANPGAGYIDNSAIGDVFFNFPHDQWFRVIMNWDISSGLSAATWHFNVAGNDVIPPGTDFTDEGGSIPNSLGGINFFSINNDYMFYLDSLDYANGFIGVEPDNEDPVAVCQDINRTLGDDGTVILTASHIDGGSTDNVGIVLFTAIPDSFNCNDIGENLVTLIIEDFAGNTDSCTAIVTIIDNTNPIINGQDVVGNLNGTGSVSIPVSSVDTGSSDNCELDSLTLTPDTFTEIGSFNAVLEGTDPSGNSESITVTVTIVNDLEDPVAVCLDVTVLLDENGDALIDGSTIDGGSTDDTGIVSFTAQPNNFNCNDLGANTVTLIVEDAVGNTDSCTATVIIEDLINPEVIGQDVTGDLNGSGSVTISVSNVDNGSNDNCSISLTLNPNTFSSPGIYSAVLEGIDPSGNSDTDTVSITIIDSTLGVNEQELTSIVIYPNPTKSIITIDLDATNSLSIIELFDITGKLVFNKILKQETQTTTLNISQLSSNIYFLVITDNSGKRMIKKLIKE